MIIHGYNVPDTCPENCRRSHEFYPEICNCCPIFNCSMEQPFNKALKEKYPETTPLKTKDQYPVDHVIRYLRFWKEGLTASWPVDSYGDITK